MRTRYVNLRIPGFGNDTPRAEILVTDGLIEDVLEDSTQTAVGGEQWIDLNDALILPGVIDGHVGFGDPGFPHRGDFTSGTAAATAGGVTCIVDLPCSSLPPLTTEEALDEKIRVADAKSHVDFMFWGGLTGLSFGAGDWRDTLAGFVDAGLPAIHLSMRSDLADCPELDFEQIAEIMQEAWRLGVPVGIHAETPEPIREKIAVLRASGRNDPSAWSEAHPPDTEYAAAAVIREICRSTGVKAHVMAVSSGDSLALIREGRQEGLTITASVCPAYLEFCDENLASIGTPLKLQPALKTGADRHRLWQGLRDGDVEMIGSGHTAVQWPEEKNNGSIWLDRPGFPGVQSTLPYLYSEGVSTGRISLERMVDLLCGAPARFFGIDHIKGALKPGMHADFVVFDDHQSWEVRASDIHGINRFTPFEGRRWTGRVRSTFLRGQRIYDASPDGREMFGVPGTGQWVARGQRR